MRQLRKLAQALDIHADERALVGLVLVYGFLLEFARALVGTISSTLFLTAFSAQSLSYIYLGSAVTIPLTGLAYLKLQARLPLPQLISGTLGMLALSLLLFRGALLVAPAPWVSIPLMIWFTVLYVLVVLSFWGLNGRLFNVRQGKRLFGLLNAGMESGQAVGGLLIPLLVLAAGPRNLLVIGAAGLCGALLIQRRIARVSPALATEAPAADDTAAPGGAAAPSAFRLRYVRLLLALATLSFLGYLYLDTIFFSLAQTHYPDPNQLANVLGVILSVTSALTIGGQVLLSAAFTRRYGVRTGVVLLPALVIGATALVAALGTALGPTLLVFWITMLARIMERAVRFSIDETSLQVMYQPLPGAQRSAVQTVIEGGMKPLAGGLAGLSILLCTDVLGFGGVQLGYVLLAIAIGWIAVALLAGREYPAMLLRSLERRQLAGATLALDDAAALTMIRSRVASPYAGEALYALDLLAEMQPDELPPALGEAVGHPDAVVRREALARIASLRLSALLPRVRQCLDEETDEAVLSAAVRAYGTIEEDDAVDRLSSFLQHPAPAVRLGAALGLVHNGGLAELVAVSEWLLGHARSERAEERSLGAQLIGAAAIPTLYRPLATLLRDPDLTVRRDATTAAGLLQHPRLWPLVVANLGDPETRAAASTALAAPAALLAVQSESARPDLAPDVRLAIVRVYGRIGSAAASAALLELLDTPDATLRQAVVAALGRCRYQAVTVAETERIVHALRWESAAAAWTLQALGDLGADPPLELLRTALERRLSLGRERIFGLLACLYDRAIIRRLQETLDATNGEQQAYGLELLDVMLPPALRAALLPLLEAGPLTAQRAWLNRAVAVSPRARVEWVRELATGQAPYGDKWLRACAVYGRRALDGNGAVDGSEEVAMLQLIEQVLMLKAVRIFAGVPDEALTGVAARLVELSVPAGTTLFEKGARGDCVYIIARGRVRVHDGERTLNELGPRDVFGEMAVLNAAPRIASVTAVEETTLLRLDQATLFELMADHAIIAQEVVRTLSAYLQNALQQLSAADQQLAALSEPEHEPGARVAQPVFQYSA